MYFRYKINTAILPESLGDGAAPKQERLREYFFVTVFDFCTVSEAVAAAGSAGIVSCAGGNEDERNGSESQNGFSDVVMCGSALRLCSVSEIRGVHERTGSTGRPDGRRTVGDSAECPGGRRTGRDRESAFAGASQESGGVAPEKEEYDPEDQIRKNQEKFYEEAGKQGISQQEARACLQVLMDDNIFRWCDGANRSSDR